MGRSATVDDVARAAGVSRQTVSNVLNSPQIVRPSTRERVERAIVELAYRPHAAARSLRTRRSSTIGIHLDPYSGGISGVLLDRFVHALTERASERGMRVLVYGAGSAQQELERLADLVDGGELDAVVITGTFVGDPRTGWLIAHGVPFVSFGRPWGGADVFDAPHPWVDVDGAAGTRAATAHCLTTHGRRVGWLGWSRDGGTGDDRERGWQEAMAAESSTGPHWAVIDDVRAARHLAEDRFAGGMLGELDALVCASDSLAVGAHLAAGSYGRADLPIIGFDNTPVAEALGLSSIEQAPELVARGALDLLMGPEGRSISSHGLDDSPRHVLVAPRLVLREPSAQR